MKNSMMQKFKLLLKNDYIFSILTKGIGVLLGIIYMVLFNRYFGSGLKGESAIVLNYVTMITIFLDCGASHAYTYLRKEDSNASQIYLSNITLLFIIFITGCCMLSCIIQDKIMSLVLIMLPIRLYANQIRIVTHIETPRKINTTTSIINILDIVILLILIILHDASFVILACFLMGKEAISLVCILIVCETKINIRIHLLPQHIKYIKHGLPAMICILLMEVNYRIDILMLESKVPIESVGIYSLAVSISERVWLIPDALRDILLSKLAKGKAAKEVAKANRFAYWCCIFFVLMLYLMGKPMINLLFGAEFEGTYEVMCIILFGVLGMVFYKMVYAYNLTNGKQKFSVMFLSGSAVTNIIGNIILIPHFGIKGAAAASVISYTVCGLLFLSYFCKHTKTPIRHMIMLQTEDISSVSRFIKS